MSGTLATDWQAMKHVLRTAMDHCSWTAPETEGDEHPKARQLWEALDELGWHVKNGHGFSFSAYSLGKLLGQRRYRASWSAQLADYFRSHGFYLVQEPGSEDLTPGELESARNKAYTEALNRESGESGGRTPKDVQRPAQDSSEVEAVVRRQLAELRESAAKREKSVKKVMGKMKPKVVTTKPKYTLCRRGDGMYILRQAGPVLAAQYVGNGDTLTPHPHQARHWVTQALAVDYAKRRIAEEALEASKHQVTDIRDIT